MELIKKYGLYYLAWLQALVATTGSLFLSEVLGWTPCKLCWFQRILMYPLVLLIAVGILRRDRQLPYYVLPLSILGAVIAAYHYLIQKGIITEQLQVCAFGVSCQVEYVGWFGFITIPLLSLIAFVVISSLMILAYRRRPHD